MTPPPAAAPKLLVVDDDVDICQTLGLCLRAEGYEVLLARNGREALELVLAHRPALVLLDLMMPVMDGWQFAAELRARGLALPLIVLSADNAVERHAGLLEAHAHLAKPFDLEQLLAQVHAVVARPASG